MNPIEVTLAGLNRGYQISDFDPNNERYDKTTVIGNIQLIFRAQGFMRTVRDGTCAIEHLKAFIDMIVRGPESGRVRKLLRRWIPELQLKRSDGFPLAKCNGLHKYFVECVRPDTDEETPDEDLGELSEAEKPIWGPVLLEMFAAMRLTHQVMNILKEKQEAEEAEETNDEAGKAEEANDEAEGAEESGEEAEESGSGATTPQQKGNSAQDGERRTVDDLATGK